MFNQLNRTSKMQQNSLSSPESVLNLIEKSVNCKELHDLAKKNKLPGSGKTVLGLLLK